MEETLNHLFINRPFSFECWLQLGIHWPLDANCLEILPEIKANFGSPIFFEVFVLAAWNIWKIRNNLIFKGVPAFVQTWRARLRADLTLLGFRVPQNLSSEISILIDYL
ncbi:hypothetical protein BRADI_2g13851v3 [Brachypodium distachyon]|uniref:Uncharacterized protein n=1 Tax=Brachypodium distachyon TaxID=15368 RepID=A0A0Q3K192_BRADI|nr:hypothetical protein BRADI_2g13851v3 [Brachypodium distachyon]